MSWEQNEVAYAHVVSRAWLSEDFRARLLKNPAEVLAANNFEVPEGATVTIAEDETTMSWDPAEKVLTLPLPERPEDMDDASLLASNVDELLWLCCCC